MREGAVQIAGVLDADDAALIVECGADFVGFPLGLHVLRGDCSEETAARIIADLPRRVEPVLITYLTEPREVATLANRIGACWVQLHGAIELPAVAELRRLAPALHLAKSLIVRAGAERELERALEAFSPHVEAFLTDTYDPQTGATGATGRVHDWAISRSLALASPRPLVLAGGLTPGNVERAIREVGPAAVDSHTGVERADGRKSCDLVTEFVGKARAAFAARVGERAAGRRPRGSPRASHPERRR
jgi:phosphoribosylanthranilate isomerase